MIRQFANAGTEDIFNGKNSRLARQTCPRGLWRIAARKLDQLDSVDTLDDLKVPPGNRLETLSGDRKGQFSIRINDKYRICFKWESEGPTDVEILDYHR
jgi:proteic killer suppression protein